METGSTDASAKNTALNLRHPVKWDKETDVVIAGFGGAGAAAAIEAADTGADVLILEKTKRPGGATRMSGGVIYASGTSTQKAAGIEDSAEEMFKYWMATDSYLKDPALVRLLADKSSELMEWLAGMGATFPPEMLCYSGAEEEYAHITPPKPRGHCIAAQPEEPLPADHPYSSLPPVAGCIVGYGRILTDLLERAVYQRKIKVMLETRVEELISSVEQEVIGVQARTRTTTLNIRARRGVVLADGGFARNLEMQKQFTSKGPHIAEGKIIMTSHPGQTGDGIKMAMAVGADLMGMAYFHTHAVKFVPTGKPTILFPGLRYPSILVNRLGRRFINEDLHYATISAAFEQQAYTVFQIFDDEVMKKLKLPEGNLKRLVNAPSIRELAGKLGITSAHLEDTINTWNRYAESGSDMEFGRKGDTVGPIKVPPFWGGELLYRFNQNYGGLKTNTEARVLDVLHGKPIPRLYAAGQTTGGRYGSRYPGSGSAILNCLVFGRIAGSNAANEAPSP